MARAEARTPQLLVPLLVQRPPLTPAPCPLASHRYRRLHSNEVIVDPDQLECSGALLRETREQLGLALAAEAAEEQGMLAGMHPPPPFLANYTGRPKRCRAAPQGSDRPPQLHRVALLTPDTLREEREGGGAAAAGAAGADGSLHMRPQDPQPQRTQLPPTDSRPADITVITQLSLDRLPSLMQQCASWRGPTAAVVYAPLARGRLAGYEGHDDPAVAALAGSTPLDVLEYVRGYYRRIAALEGEAGGRCLGGRLGRLTVALCMPLTGQRAQRRNKLRRLPALCGRPRPEQRQYHTCPAPAPTPPQAPAP